MKQFRINPGVVREELCKLLQATPAAQDLSGKEAARHFAYVAGMKDLAAAIIKRYEEGNNK